MDIKNFNADSRNLKTRQKVTEEFETLRLELHKYADFNGNLSDSEDLLKISKKLDELHLEYIRITEEPK